MAKKLLGQKTKSDKSGFTLIELLVVIAIISLLSSVVLASLGTARKKAKVAEVQQEIKSFKSAMELYRLNNGSYYNTGSYTRAQTSGEYNPFVAAMGPYIPIGNLKIFAFAADTHYVPAPFVFSPSVQMNTCGGKPVLPNGYLVIFNIPDVAGSFPTEVNASAGYSCFIND